LPSTPTRPILAGAVLVAALAGCASTAQHATTAAGTALARGDATGAVPQLQEGNTAIGAFSSASAQCS
jgi:type IV pilus biogenesis protein CpaD/CtpE